MNKIIKITILLCFSIAPAQAKGIFGEIGGAIGGIIGKSISESSQTLTSNDKEKLLLEMANELNKKCPIIMSKYLRLDTVISGPGLRVTYYYTLIKDTSKSASRKEIADYMHQATTSTKSSVCSNPKSLRFPKDGVTVVYSYHLSDGVYIGEVEVKPRDCGY
ncbi:MAG: hypothetical protein NTX38_15075 [Methylobacter sp.]|nr:hypothetical protein [Methylobacter sp.]